MKAHILIGSDCAIETDTKYWVLYCSPGEYLVNSGEQTKWCGECWKILNERIQEYEQGWNFEWVKNIAKEIF